jgi:probable HAF family extracellular repeat protein
MAGSKGAFMKGTSRFASKLLLLPVLIVSIFGCLAAGQTYHYAAINYPGAQTTVANGINNSNLIVGYYMDSNHHNHGFLYKNATYIRINVPNATDTFALGINDYGDIVGTYGLPGTATNPSNSHGFLLHNGAFKTIDCPGSLFSGALGINKYGTIVGECQTSNGDQGFIYTNGTLKIVNAPTVGPNNTQLNGISNLGEIVGQVFSGDNLRGFWMVGSEFDFLKPYLATDNQAKGVNGHGDIVGCYSGARAFLAYNPESGETEGSTEKFPVLHTLSPFGSVNSCAMSINYVRAIVGWYYDSSNRQHGFLGVPQ